MCVPKASLEFRTLEAAAAALVAGRTTFANPLKSLHADEARLHAAHAGIDTTVRRAPYASRCFARSQSERAKAYRRECALLPAAPCPNDAFR